MPYRRDPVPIPLWCFAAAVIIGLLFTGCAVIFSVSQWALP